MFVNFWVENSIIQGLAAFLLIDTIDCMENKYQVKMSIVRPPTLIWILQLNSGIAHLGQVVVLSIFFKDNTQDFCSETIFMANVIKGFVNLLVCLFSPFAD